MASSRVRAFVHNCIAHPLWWLTKQLLDAAIRADDLAVRLHDATAGVELPDHVEGER